MVALRAVAALAILAAAVPPAAAQLGFDQGDGFATVEVGYVAAKSDLTGKTLDGWGAGVELSGLDLSGGRYALGANLSYFAAETSATIGGAATELHYRTIPVLLQGRVHLGDPAGRWIGHVGLGLGVGFSRLETSTATLYHASYQSSFGFGVPVGVAVAISDRAFVEGKYTLYWTDESFFENDLAHRFGVGIGSRF
jgi:hypothetical protein